MNYSVRLAATTDKVSWPAHADHGSISYFTVALWIRVHKPLAGGSYFASKWGGAAGNSTFALYTTTGSDWATGVYPAGVASAGSTSQAIRHGKWVHVVFTWDGTTKRLYLDGRLVYAVTPATGGPAPHSTEPINLGRREASANSMAADIALFRMWSSVATSAQVEELYIRGRKFATPLIEALMTEGSGASVASTGSHTGAGAITGATWITGVPMRARTAAPTF